MRWARWIAALSAATLMAACDPRLPLPPLAPQPASVQPVVVDHAPPAARVDVITDPPAEMKNPRWIDGQWLWRSQRWVWEKGRWADFAPETRYAVPYVVRRSDGELLWYQGIQLDNGRDPGATPP